MAAATAQTNVGWAVEFPYHSDAYLEQADQGLIHIPADLLGANGKARSIEEIQTDRTLSPEERQHLLSEAAAQHALPVHPAELYSTFTAWLIAALLIAYFTLPHAPGRVFALMLILESISRFLLEEIRAEPVFTPFGKHIFGTMSYSMVLSIPLLALGIALWFAFRARPNQTPAASTTIPAAATA